MSWWEMMQIVWWGSLGWALCLGVVTIAWAVIAEIVRVQQVARDKRARDKWDKQTGKDLSEAWERDRHTAPTNGRDHGNN